MSQYNKNSRLNQEIDFGEFIKNIFKIFLIILILWVSYVAYFKGYNPKVRNYIVKTNYAYKTIEKEAMDYYKKNGEIYKDKESTIDEFCTLLSNKYSKNGGDCIRDAFGIKKNFEFKNGVAIYGMERAPFALLDTLVKDFIIDINGDKGENTIGIDRVPVRVYSKERMGGLLSPVNCKADDVKDFGIFYSPMCQAGVDIDFMTQNIPFGFDVAQIGGDEGKTRLLNRDVPFARADCIAFGGEMVAADEYCETRGYYWLPACYHEYPCSVELAKK